MKLELIVLLIIYSVLWARLSTWIYENESFTVMPKFWLVTYGRWSPATATSVAKGLPYVVLGSLPVFLTCILGLGLTSQHFQFKAQDMLWVALGALAEISLSALLVRSILRISGWYKLDIRGELAAVPWIANLGAGSRFSRMVGVFASAIVEEFYFRGALLILMLEVTGLPLVAIACSTGIFALQQLVQLKTRLQMAVILCSCVSIGTVGGLLVLGTGSVTVAALAHAAFVVLYLYDPGSPSGATGMHQS